MTVKLAAVTASITEPVGAITEGSQAEVKLACQNFGAIPVLVVQHQLVSFDSGVVSTLADPAVQLRVPRRSNRMSLRSQPGVASVKLGFAKGIAKRSTVIQSHLSSVDAYTSSQISSGSANFAMQVIEATGS